MKSSPEQIDTIYRKAISQHKEFKKLDKEKIYGIIGRSLDEIDRLEKAAYRPNTKIIFSNNEPANIVALWDFSGPGVYDENDENFNRYKNVPWAMDMERERLNYTASLAKEISGILDTETHKTDSPFKNAPKFIYNGTTRENQRVNILLEKDGIFIPPEKMLIIYNKEINNTNDQIKTMVWPEELHQPGKVIGLVSHAPHLWRIVHILNKYKTLPGDMKIKLFPIATPTEGKDEYAMMEIRGLLYYSLLAKEKSAGTEAYPYEIYGEK